MEWINKIISKIVRHSPSNAVTATLEVDNQQLFGKTVSEVTSILGSRCSISCILKKREKLIVPARYDYTLNEGDQLLVSALPEDMEAAKALIGKTLAN